jgi:hypothetical protein
MPTMSLDVIKAELNYARLFHEATGGIWHEVEQAGTGYFKCSCSKEKHSYYYAEFLYQHTNPTYTNPADILNRMKEYCGEERYGEFIYQCITEMRTLNKTSYLTVMGFVDSFILNAPALLRKAVEFLEVK